MRASPSLVTKSLLRKTRSVTTQSRHRRSTPSAIEASLSIPRPDENCPAVDMGEPANGFNHIPSPRIVGFDKNADVSSSLEMKHGTNLTQEGRGEAKKTICALLHHNCAVAHEIQTEESYNFWKLRPVCWLRQCDCEIPRRHRHSQMGHTFDRTLFYLQINP